MEKKSLNVKIVFEFISLNIKSFSKMLALFSAVSNQIILTRQQLF